MTNIKCIALAIAAALFIFSGLSSAQSIAIVSGNGQLACEACAFHPITSFDNMVVQVKNAAGTPVAGATVSWTFASVSAATGSVVPTSTTDSNGMSSVSFQLAPFIGLLSTLSYAQGTFTATLTALPSGTPGSTGQSVIFTESDALTDVQLSGQGSGIIEVATTLLTPSSGTVISGPAGSTQAGAIQIRVQGEVGALPGVPGVAVIVQPAAAGAPSLSCATPLGGQPNTVITDSSGTATCNVVFGGVQGNGTANLVIGQADNPFGSFNINFTTTQGLPGGVKISSGNNQSGTAGSILPLTLTAVVVDQAGNTLSGVNVTWGGNGVSISDTVQNCPSNGNTCVYNTRTTSDANGKVSANVKLGSTAGNVTITITVANQANLTNSFTETVNLTVTQLQIVSGNSQTAIVNQAFPSPLIVQVNNAGAPVPGVPVSFAVTSGSGTLSSSSATTNSSGQASINVTAGATAGNLVITATVGNFSQTFNLVVSPPGPSVTPSSFYNAASLVTGAISPCSLSTIIATGLAPGLQGAILPPIVGLLPYVVNNDSVLFSQGSINSYAPIQDVANINGQEQMTIEIPCELAPGPVNVTVTVGSGNKTVPIQLASAAPGIFQEAGSDKVLRAVILRQDGSFVTKENPARQGDTVYVFVTGLGPVNPQIGTNQIGIPGTVSNVPNLNNIIVGVANNGVQVVSASYATDLIGIYVIGFVVPTGSTGDLPLAVAVSQAGTLIFGNPSIIPVQ